MKFKKFFILSGLLLATMTVLNFLAFQNFWYWRWPWFDKPMHFIGGLLVGLVAIQFFLFFFRHNQQEVSGLDIALVAIVSALMVGVLWEWFEFTADKQVVARVQMKTLGMIYQGWAGSLKDLIFDLIGGVSAAILFLTSFIWRQQKAQ